MLPYKRGTAKAHMGARDQANTSDDGARSKVRLLRLSGINGVSRCSCMASVEIPYFNDVKEFGRKVIP